jgi:predicted nucleic acid-binding protein
MTAYLLDTNILLRLVDSTAPAHNLVLDAVAAIWGSGNDCVLTGQVLIEFWVVATRPIQVAVMLTHQVTHLLTLNPDDFSGLSEIEVVHPQAIA